MPGHVRRQELNRHVRMPFGCIRRECMHIGATWLIRLNRPCAAAMRPYVKLLRPLVQYCKKYCNTFVLNIIACDIAILFGPESIAIEYCKYSVAILFADRLSQNNIFCHQLLD